MGTDDFFKKKKAARKARQAETRIPKSNSYLIVTEGIETERNYFNGIAKYIKENFGGTIDIKPVPTFVIRGEGKNTTSLVDAVIKIVKEARIPYENVWLVFDKDDFSNFEEAIKLAERHDFNVAWSNPSFEYWLFLHFEYSDAALHRDEWTKKLKQFFRRSGINKAYAKNMKNIFEVVTKHGSLKSAISHGYKIHNYHVDECHSPENSFPCTTVHELVKGFSYYLDDIL